MTPTTKDAYRLLHQGARALARVESVGICVDSAYLDSAIDDVSKKIVKLEKELALSNVAIEWQKMYGKDANLQSRSQLGRVLSKVLGIKLSKTDKGADRTDVTSLAQIDDPFIRIYSELAKMKKARATYLVGLKREVVNGKVHPFFNLHTVQTFRSSSDSPNFQNFPVRDKEIMGLIRRAFIPRPGRRLVEVDFGGIEVRVAACYHRDPAMLRYIHDPNSDMHRDMAAQLFCIPEEEVTKELRFAAKSYFVFAQFYGDYFGNCAPSLWNAAEGSKTVSGKSVRDLLSKRGIRGLGDRENCQRGSYMWHVREVESDFWNKRFPVYSRWRKNLVKTYEQSGHVQLLTGFTCRGLKRKNEITNYPIQGAAFHCLLWSLIQIVLFELKKRKMKSLIVGQIHDSLIGDVPEDEIEQFESLVTEIMTEALPAKWRWIIVPLTIEITRYSHSWAEHD